jgi:type II secretory pathway pseudopilin PulG
MKGFTFIEILILIFLIFILILFFIPISLDFYKIQQLETHSQGILQTLRRAQQMAMAVESDSSFGIYLTDDYYILFKGDSYQNRDSQYDEVFDLPKIITLDGLTEIVFSKLEGIPKGSPGYCEGICTPCYKFNNPGSCRRQDGCTWIPWLRWCVGTCTPCENYKNERDCEDQSGCIWHPGAQGGDIILRVNSENRIININEMGRINLQ